MIFGKQPDDMQPHEGEPDDRVKPPIEVLKSMNVHASCLNAQVVEAMYAYKEQFEQWVPLKNCHNPNNSDLTIVLFENGEMHFYNDTNWPKCLVTHTFELPQKP